MSRACAYIVLAGMICAAAIGGCGGQSANPTSAVAQVTKPPSEQPRTVDVPSEEFPTIQSAIDALPDRSTVRLGPERYTESLTITRKRVNIVGSGAFDDAATEIVSDDPEAAVITFGPLGGGLVENLVVRDGAIGIEGVRLIDGEGNVIRPLPVLIRQTYVHHVGQGIFGSFGDIAVTGSVIRNIDWNGMCIVASEMFTSLNNFISNMGNVGMLIFNYGGEGTIWISNTEFKHNEQGGLAIVGDAKAVEITQCHFLNNTLVGILLLDVGKVALTDTTVSIVHLADAPGLSSDVGDGIVASSPDSNAFIEVDGCDFRKCDRVGMLFEDCDGVIRGTRSFMNKYGLVLQGFPKPDLGPGNVLHPNDTNVVTDGDLPVPDQPLAVPEVP